MTRVNQLVEAIVAFIFGIVILVVGITSGADLAITILGGVLAAIGLVFGILEVTKHTPTVTKAKKKK